MFNPLTCLSTARIPVKKNATVVDIGNQTIDISQKIFDILCQNNLLKTPPKDTKDFYYQLGYEKYTAIDVNEDLDAIAMDLNQDLIETYNYREKFDLVNNNGSSEHIFNQYHVFKNIHQLCKTDGYMLHVLPLTRWINHGFYNYNPVLFRDIAIANQYQLVFFHIGNRHGDVIDLGQTIGLQEAFNERSQQSINNAINQLFEYGQQHHGNQIELFNIACMLKTNDLPFQIPMQGRYVSAIDNSDIKKSYSSQIQQNKPSASPTPKKQSKYNKLSILNKFKKIETLPFSYFFIEKALDDKIFKELSDSFPEQSILDHGSLEPNGFCHRLFQNNIIGNDNIPNIWQDFIAYHSSTEFYHQVIDIFESSILQLLGEKPLEYLRHAPLGKRYLDDTAIVTEAQCVLQEPLESSKTSRTDHLDNPNEIYAALIYFKPPNDKSSGGDFLIHDCDGKAFDANQEGVAINQNQYQLHQNIPYKANNVVMFLNSPFALHGVSTRKRATKRRRSINITAEIQSNAGGMWAAEQHSDHYKIISSVR